MVRNKVFNYMVKIKNIFKRYSKAQEMAKKVLYENCMFSAPILAYKIAENYGIKVLFCIFTDEKISGMINFQTDTISINYNDDTKRANFTTAVLLGYFFLYKEFYLSSGEIYKHIYRKPIQSYHNSDIEKEVNAFAANLLVPQTILDEYSKITTKESLSRLFIVSEEVIGFRLMG